MKDFFVFADKTIQKNHIAVLLCLHKAFRILILIVSLYILTLPCQAILPSDTSGNSDGSPLQAQAINAQIQQLFAQGVKPGQILGHDQSGIPIVCGYTGVIQAVEPSQSQSTMSVLPDLTRGWENIPNVIRTDGIDNFRLEVDMNGMVGGATLYISADYLILPTPSPITMQDDGLGEDRVAADFIYTAGPFYYDTSKTFPDYFGVDPASPAGLFVDYAGYLTFGDSSSDYIFLVAPKIGLLRADIPDTEMFTLSTDVVVSPHLINIRTSTHETQKFLRLISYNLRNLTLPIYDVLPDHYDFLVCFSTNKVEWTPRTTSLNFVSGRHVTIKCDYTGTGAALRDYTASFGSSGRLLSISALDGLGRGISGYVATHELMHQWSAFISTSLGLNDDIGHYLPRSSTGSMVGGYEWIDNGDTTFTVNCNQGQNGGYYLPPIDQYMMGLIDANEVPPHYVYDSSLSLKCGSNQPVMQSEIVTTVTIDDIIDLHGPRIPGPDQARREFKIAFVAETHDRFLNATEMTFYEILAEHYTKVLPPEDPDPRVGQSWPPVTRYFGDATRWCSRIIPWGDVTADIHVDFLDYTRLAQSWLTNDPAIDFVPFPGGDGIIDILELYQMSDHWLNYCP